MVSGCDQDIGADLGLEHSVVVLGTVHWWPAFDPLFFLGGEAQFRDQDNCVVLIAPIIGEKANLTLFYFVTLPQKVK